MTSQEEQAGQLLLAARLESWLGHFPLSDFGWANYLGSLLHLLIRKMGVTTEPEIVDTTCFSRPPISMVQGWLFHHHLCTTTDYKLRGELALS